VKYCTCEPIQSPATGIGPQNAAETRNITNSSSRAKQVSIRFRPRVPAGGRARYRTGPVPGRRPIKRPPLSVGSVLKLPPGFSLRRERRNDPCTSH
jgi:hypothetical protein